jgi:hypothetical protein
MGKRAIDYVKMYMMMTKIGLESKGLHLIYLILEGALLSII